MFNKVKSLIWLRTNMLISNKNLLLQILMPYGLAVLYKELLLTESESNLSILFTCLAMSFAFSLGNMLSNIISEEKEKNNLRTLILSGVKSSEYLLGTLFYPVVLGVVSILVFPKLVDASLSDFYIQYLIVSLLTAIAVVLLNLLIALISTSQSKTQVNTLPIMFITSLLPMFSSVNETLNIFNKYSFMGSYTSFFTDMKDFSFNQPSFYALIIWIMALLVLNILAFKTVLKKTDLIKRNFIKNSNKEIRLKTSDLK